MRSTILAAELRPRSFGWQVDGKVASVTLSRPERKNPLTFESYAELRDTFRHLNVATDVKAVVITGAAENFSSGGDVHDIIGPLVAMRREGRTDELLAFTRMTGDLVKAMRGCPQPIVAAVDGVCVGAGAILAMASDLRLGTVRSKVAFLFVKVGLSGADMGACAMLPRIVGQGRASELLYTGRVMERKRSGGASSTGSRRPSGCRMRRWSWRDHWPTGPALPTRSRSAAFIRSGGWGWTRRSRSRRRRKRCACRRRISPGPTRRSGRRSGRCSRGIEGPAGRATCDKRQATSDKR
jgi:hypothetical protein